MLGIYSSPLLNNFFLSEAATVRVSFHARLTSTLVNFMGRLQPFTITNNEGDAFNGSTGIFTAPVNGTYFFAGSSTSYSNDKYVYMWLYKEGTGVSWAYSRSDADSYSSATCHATMHLTEGERVWLQSTSSSSQYYGSPTSFTGFLINIDY